MDGMGLWGCVIEVKHQSQELDIESGPGISIVDSVQAVKTSKKIDGWSRVAHLCFFVV